MHACAVHAQAELRLQQIWDSDFQQEETPQKRTVAGLAELLAFADAVGSRSGIISACVSDIEHLKLVVQLPAGEADAAETVILRVDGEAYYVDDR